VAFDRTDDFDFTQDRYDLTDLDIDSFKRTDRIVWGITAAFAGAVLLVMGYVYATDDGHYVVAENVPLMTTPDR